MRRTQSEEYRQSRERADWSMRTTTGPAGGRPLIMSGRGVVASGHYLATEIGVDILRRGGNAMDAAAAVGIALTVLQPHQCGIGGEVPMLVYAAAERGVASVSGHGVAPRAATLKHFQELGVQIIPGDGFLPALVPPAVASWIELLRRFGALRLADVLMPSIALAEEGFPMYDSLQGAIAGMRERFAGEWPSSAAVFLSDGEPPAVGTLWRQTQWAATFRQLIQAEGRFADREAGLRAAHGAFYRGAIAESIVEFLRTPVRDATGRAHAGLLTLEDFAAFAPRVEAPVSTTYRGIAVHKCGPWTQGPVLLQSLALLEGYDLRAMAQADYIHTVVECIKLAFADREYYYGDPAFVQVPFDRLLSREYNEERRRLVDPERASLELRPGGTAPLRAESIRDVNVAFVLPRVRSTHPPGGVCTGASDASPGDTTKLEVIDAAGNMVSATPSGGWLQSSPIIAGLGFPLGTRGQMFSLVPGHPNCLAPGKRPRTTLTPSLATRDGAPYLSFGSPGGDMQDQWALLFFLNVVEFGLSLQEAVEAPTFWTPHAPSSFYPRQAEPGVLCTESRIPAEVRDDLAARGHVIRTADPWAGGNTLAASIDTETGVRCAAASPRYEAAYAAAW